MAIASFNVTTLTALLGSVACVNVGNRLSCQSSLVLQEGFELEPTPTSQDAVERASQLLLLLDVQLLKHEGVEGECNDLLADAVVRVLDETVFPSAQTSQATFGGLRAFALETTPKVVVLAFHSPEILAVVKLVVRENADVLAATVNAENGVTVRRRWLCLLNEPDQIPLVLVRLVLKLTGRADRRPVGVGERVLDEGDFDATVNSREFHRGFSDSAGITVVANRREPTRLWLFGVELAFSFGLDGLEDVGRFAASRTNQLRRQLCLRPQGIVGCFVKFDTRDALVGEAKL